MKKIMFVFLFMVYASICIFAVTGDEVIRWDANSQRVNAGVLEGALPVNRLIRNLRVTPEGYLIIQFSTNTTTIVASSATFANVTCSSQTATLVLVANVTRKYFKISNNAATAQHLFTSAVGAAARSTGSILGANTVPSSVFESNGTVVYTGAIYCLGSDSASTSVSVIEVK